MKNLSVILERKGKRKYKSVEINLTVVWGSGSITKKVEVDEDLLTKILYQKSSNARQLIIDKRLVSHSHKSRRNMRVVSRNPTSS